MIIMELAKNVTIIAKNVQVQKKKTVQIVMKIIQLKQEIKENVKQNQKKNHVIEMLNLKNVSHVINLVLNVMDQVKLNVLHV